MSGVLTDVQTQAVKLMIGDKYYASVKIIPEQEPGNIPSLIAQALGKVGGICAIVATPSCIFRGTDAPGPQIDPLSLSIDIVEFVAVNRGAKGSQLPCSEVAEHTAWLLHYPNHAATRSDSYPLIADRMRLVPDKQFLIYRVEFKTVGMFAGIP